MMLSGLLALVCEVGITKVADTTTGLLASSSAVSIARERENELHSIELVSVFTTDQVKDKSNTEHQVEKP